jgi:hypothetical protein
MRLKKQGCFWVSLSAFFISSVAHSEGIIDFNIPIGHKIETGTIEGSVTVHLETSLGPVIKIAQDFYGADTNGFSIFPSAPLVTPLELGYVKMGGSLHATYNWELNAYHNYEILYVYSPLVSRLQYIQNNYHATPMFEVNMLGWQPVRDPAGKIIYQESADAKHAGNAIRYINGTNKIGLKHIMMGNEPFDTEEFHEMHIPSADEYIDKYINYAIALRTAQESVSGNPNDIKLWGPEINTGWTGWQTNHLPDCITDYDRVEKVTCSYGNGQFSEFIPYFLFRLAAFESDPIKNPKKYKMLDYITFHYYSLFRTNFNDPTSIILDKNGNQNISAMLESVNVWDSANYINKYDSASPKKIAPNIIGKFKNWCKQYYPAAKVAVTEFGIDSVANISYHPIVRPLYLADLVARAGVAGLDTFINSFLQSGDISSSWAMIDKRNKTTLYYVYSLFTNYFLGDVVTTSDTFGDLVNAYSVKTKDGINVFMVNKDTKVHNAKLQFKSKKDIQIISEIQLPAWSLTVLVVPANSSEKIKIHQYGAKEMGIAVDSSIF